MVVLSFYFFDFLFIDRLVQLGEFRLQLVDLSLKIFLCFLMCCRFLLKGIHCLIDFLLCLFIPCFRDPGLQVVVSQLKVSVLADKLFHASSEAVELV